MYPFLLFVHKLYTWLLVCSYQHAARTAACLTLCVRSRSSIHIQYTVFTSWPNCNACKRRDGIMKVWMSVGGSGRSRINRKHPLSGISANKQRIYHDEMLMNAWLNWAESVKLWNWNTKQSSGSYEGIMLKPQGFILYCFNYNFFLPNRKDG